MSKIEGHISWVVMFLAITGLLLPSCKKNIKIVNDNLIQFSEFPNTDSIYFDDVVEFMHGNPKALYIQDTVLVIFNDGNGIKYHFYNYYINKGEFSNGYLPYGRGPGECLGLFDAGFCSNSFWGYDITLKKILTIDKSIAVSENTPKIFNEYAFIEDAYKIVFIDSLSFLAVGNDKSKSKIEKIDLASGKAIDSYGQYNSIPENIPLSGFKDAYLAYIYSKPSGGKLVLPYRYTDIVEIFDTDKDYKSIAIQGPEQFDVDFEVGIRDGQHYMMKTDNTRKAFVNGTVTENYIYLLFSGHNRQEDNWSYGKYIFVYDWEGNPIRKLTLDRYIYAFTVSENDNVIYSHDRETGNIIKAVI